MWYNETPSDLSRTYFSSANMDYIQRQVQNNVRQTTSYSIQAQNQGDLFNLMSKFYVDYRSDPTNNIASQVAQMNTAVIASATDTVSNGILQNITYLRDISRPIVPPSIPRSTSSYGTNIGRPI